MTDQTTLERVARAISATGQITYERCPKFYDEQAQAVIDAYRADQKARGVVEVPLEMLKWVVENFDALVTRDEGHGSFIRGTRTELAGFGLKVNEIRDMITTAKLAAYQKEQGE